MSHFKAIMHLIQFLASVCLTVKWSLTLREKITVDIHNSSFLYSRWTWNQYARLESCEWLLHRSL